MTNRKPIFAIVILLIILIGGLGYFAMRPSQHADVQNPRSTDTTATATPEGIDTNPHNATNMTPYSYGIDNEIRFSYPTGWYPHDKHGGLFLLRAPNTPDAVDTELYAYGPQITVRDYNLTDSKGNKLTRAQYDAYIKTNPPATKDIEGNPIERSTVTINGIQMTRTNQLEYAGSNRTLTYQILKGDIAYEFRLFPYEPASNDAQDKLYISDFDALMQTVKFAE